MLLLHHLRCVHLLILHTLLAVAASQAVSTTVISVTSTKTVHVTATDYAHACDNFVGACVVYGTYGAAPYTTTVYVGRSGTAASLTTSTTTIVATTTVSNSGDCANFVGACVVYATNGRGSASRTVHYAASSTPHSAVGNNQGYIGTKQPDGGDGYIGNAAPRQSWHWKGLLGLGAATILWVLCI